MPYLHRVAYKQQIKETEKIGKGTLDICRDKLLFSFEGSIVAYKAILKEGLLHIEDGESHILYIGRRGKEPIQDLVTEREEVIITYLLEKGEEYFFGLEEKVSIDLEDGFLIEELEDKEPEEIIEDIN